MASLARNVFKPSPTNSLPLPPGSSSASTQRGRQADFNPCNADIATFGRFFKFQKRPYPHREKKSNLRVLPKLALCARRVDAELDPGGRGKDWVGKGLGTVRARLDTVRARLATVRSFKRNF